MTRATLALLAISTALGGCIVYETRDKEDVDCRGDDCETTAPRDDLTFPDFGGSDPDPVDDGLFLTVAEGLPGEVVFTTLEASGDLELLQVTAVDFGGPIDVLDQVDREDEILLVVEIDGHAKPERVDVFVTFGADDVRRVSTPFTILEPSGADTGDTGDTGGADTPPGDTGTADPTEPDPGADDSAGDTGDTGHTDCP